MRVLFAIHQFFPDYSSGTEVLLLGAAQEMQKRGHEVTIFTGYPEQEPVSDSQRFDNYVYEGIRVCRFRHSYMPMGDQRVVAEIEYCNELAAHRFADLMKTDKPDIVHFYHFGRLGSLLIDTVRQAGIPAFYTPTDFWAICFTGQLHLEDGSLCSGPTPHSGNCVKHAAIISNRASRLSALATHVPDAVSDWISVLAKAVRFGKCAMRDEIAAMSRRKDFNVSRLNQLQQILSPTQFMTDMLVRYGVNAGIIRQSAYGIDLAGYEPFLRGRTAESPVFGFIGTLAPHKGCHVLLSAFNLLPRDAARLKIYGSNVGFNDYRDSLSMLAQGNEAVEFCGTFPATLMPQILRDIDVLVVPSTWYENAPLVIHAALAAGCPVIASDLPGMSSIIRSGHNGLLFDPGNAESLRDCMSQLIDRPQFLQELSNNCMPPKPLETYVDELISLYGASLNKERQPA